MSSLCNIVCEGCLLPVNACTLRFLFTLPGCTSFASQILPVRLVYSSFIIDGSECHVNRNIIFQLANMISKQKPSAPDVLSKSAWLIGLKPNQNFHPLLNCLLLKLPKHICKFPPIARAVVKFCWGSHLHLPLNGLRDSYHRLLQDSDAAIGFHLWD